MSLTPPTQSQFEEAVEYLGGVLNEGENGTLWLVLSPLTTQRLKQSRSSQHFQSYEDIPYDLKIEVVSEVIRLAPSPLD